MKTIPNVVLIEGKLASFINSYIENLRRNIECEMKEFSDEAILYAFLEYASHPRKMNDAQRIEYLHGKCLEYEGRDHVYVTIEDDGYGHYFITPKPNDQMPF